MRKIRIRMAEKPLMGLRGRKEPFQERERRKISFQGMLLQRKRLMAKRFLGRRIQRLGMLWFLKT
ncbi:hypothetical protein IMSAGC019_00549 [Lachnospiraceae bacterium]|nr:hypothetical protein IMSAGC019_00549 [Lachnospiraceae bacterium]